VKAIRTKREPRIKPSDDASLEAAHCLGCNRIWIRNLTTGEGSDECGICGRELYPVTKRVIAGELKLGDGYDARVGQDNLLRDTAYVLRALLDRTSCECSSMGSRCPHCKGKALLEDFPGPAEGTLEDDWATLKGEQPSQPEPQKFDPNEMGLRQRQLMADEEAAQDETNSVDDEADDFSDLLESV